MIDHKQFYYPNSTNGHGIELLKHAAISIENYSNDKTNDDLPMTNNQNTNNGSNNNRIINGLFWLKNAATFMVKYSDDYSNDSNEHSIVASEIEIENQCEHMTTNENDQIKFFQSSNNDLSCRINYDSLTDNYNDENNDRNNNNQKLNEYCDHNAANNNNQQLLSNINNDHAYAKCSRYNPLNKFNYRSFRSTERSDSNGNVTAKTEP